MQIDNLTTVADLINYAATNPGLLNLNLGGLNLLVKSKNAARNDGLSEDLTLPEFYEQWYKVKIAVRNRQHKNTIRERETSLKYWQRLTGNPKLKEINDSTIDRFVDGLYQTPKKGGGKIGEQTVRKHINAITSVLVYAGPKTPKYKRALGLIPEIPEFPEIQKRVDVNSRTPTMREFEKILKACRVATRPVFPDITAPEWFYNAYLFIYATGVRYEDLIDARWSRIRRIQDLKCLVIPSEKEKTHRERIVPINSIAEQALNRMPRRTDNDLIFAWNETRATNPEKAVQEAIIKQRRKIAEAAGLNPVLANFHAIRRLTASMLDPAAASNVLGNNPLTCRMHYQTVAVAARAVEALPIPEGIEK